MNSSGSRTLSSRINKVKVQEINLPCSKEKEHKSLLIKVTWTYILIVIPSLWILFCGALCCVFFSLERTSHFSYLDIAKSAKFLPAQNESEMLTKHGLYIGYFGCCLVISSLCCILGCILRDCRFFSCVKWLVLL